MLSSPALPPPVLDHPLSLASSARPLKCERQSTRFMLIFRLPYNVLMFYTINTLRCSLHHCLYVTYTVLHRPHRSHNAMNLLYPRLHRHHLVHVTTSIRIKYSIFPSFCSPPPFLLIFDTSTGSHHPLSNTHKHCAFLKTPEHQTHFCSFIYHWNSSTFVFLVSRYWCVWVFDFLGTYVMVLKRESRLGIILCHGLSRGMSRTSWLRSVCVVRR